MILKKSILTISLLLVLVGCASTPLFKPSRTSRMQFVESNNVASSVISEAIINGKVIDGMTTEQVRATWGKPKNTTSEYSEDCINCSEWYAGGEEMWSYGWDLISSAYKKVMFKNGVVTEVIYQYK